MSMNQTQTTASIPANENISIFEILEKVMEESLDEVNKTDLADNESRIHHVSNVKVNNIQKQRDLEFNDVWNLGIL